MHYNLVIPKIGYIPFLDAELHRNNTQGQYNWVVTVKTYLKGNIIKIM